MNFITRFMMKTIIQEIIMGRKVMNIILWYQILLSGVFTKRSGFNE